MSDSLIIHATSVAVAGHAVLITGRSGAGKSALALEMIAMGAALVADDRTLIYPQGEQVIAESPPTIRGKIEARGVGILCCPPAPPTAVKLVVDLNEIEAERMPRKRNIMLFSVALPLLYRAKAPHFAAALMIHLQHGSGT